MQFDFVMLSLELNPKDWTPCLCDGIMLHMRVASSYILDRSFLSVLSIFSKLTASGYIAISKSGSVVLLIFLFYSKNANVFVWIY